ncbi:MAG: hypothetical protein RLZ12_188 [Bacillota bacterium]
MQKLDLTNINIRSPKLPKAFHQTKIVLLTDLHESTFGPSNSVLIQLIANAQPDYIFCVGDFIDHNLKVAVALLQELVAICPVYFVPGNHEYHSGRYPEFVQELLRLHVHVLKNSHLYLTKKQDQIILAGIDDPTFKANPEPNYFKILRKILKMLRNTLVRLKLLAPSPAQKKASLQPELEQALAGTKSNYYTILLSHRPEQLPLYKTYPIDLVCAGHAHGGLVQLPWLGGLLSGEQGLFPKYAQGLYQEHGTKLIVSRGLGDSSSISLRVNNNPEVVLITLLCT